MSMESMEKNALVWGAGGAIGRAIAEHLAAAGWRVVAVGRDEAALPESAALAVEIADVADPFSLQQAVIAAGYEFEAIHLWVYAIGDILAAPVAEMEPAGWRRIMDANLDGPFLAVKMSLPLLAQDAHLMFLGAVSERLRLPGLSAYAAAKAGLEAFADTLRKEERRKKITVIRPGAVDTSLWDKVPMNKPKDAMSPQKLAAKLLEAYEQGHKGTLDLVH